MRSDSEEEPDQTTVLGDLLQNIKYSNHLEDPISFQSNLPPTLTPQTIESIWKCSPEKVYSLFVNSVRQYLLDQTNLYGTAKLDEAKKKNSGVLSKGSRLKRGYLQI